MDHKQRMSLLLIINPQVWITGMLSKPLVRAVEQQRSRAVITVVQFPVTVARDMVYCCTGHGQRVTVNVPLLFCSNFKKFHCGLRY
jgi:hypothetical protein